MKRWIWVLAIVSLCITQPSVQAAKKNRAYWESTGDIVWDVHTKKKWIAFTFDDGPHPRYTKQILDILHKHHAKATFFVVGKRAQQYPHLLKEMQNNGHEIANHTYHHPMMSQVNMEKLTKEIQLTDEVIHGITGKTPRLFRPPGGEYSEKVVQASKTGNHLVIMWSWTQDTKDWSNPGTEKIVTNVCRNARPGNIVLFHDFGRNRTQTVQAVEKIIQTLSQEGYKFVTVSELLSERPRWVPTKH
jgi:polysaccharide deacetylase family sporulation protein PdaB